MGKRAFWPGFEWRVLAHKRHDAGKATLTSYVEDGQVELHSSDFDCPIEFDELVIDQWFHLEQMSDRDWWIGLGSYEEGSDYYRINVSVDGSKRVRVTVEQEAMSVSRPQGGTDG